jgi:hypothetical protein
MALGVGGSRAHSITVRAGGRRPRAAGLTHEQLESGGGGVVAVASAPRVASRNRNPVHAGPSLYLPMTGALPGPRFVLSTQKNHDDRDDGRQIPIRTIAPPTTLSPTATSPDPRAAAPSRVTLLRRAICRCGVLASGRQRMSTSVVCCVVVCRRFEMAVLDHNTSQHDAMRCGGWSDIVSWTIQQVGCRVYVPFCTKLFFELMIYRASYFVAIRRRYIHDM